MVQDKTKSGWQGFLEMCSQIDSPEDFNQIFDLFLTIEERETLASRFWIVKSLLQGELTQREIAEKFHVSIAQITRGSNAMKIISPKLRAALKTWVKKK